LRAHLIGEMVRGTRYSTSRAFIGTVRICQPSEVIELPEEIVPTFIGLEYRKVQRYAARGVAANSYYRMKWVRVVELVLN